MPAAITTFSARSWPFDVTTPAARPLLTRMDSTAMFSKTFAPRIVAPLMSAIVVSIGLVWPSRGR